MDFDLSEQHKMLANLVRGFMEAEIEPIAKEIDRDDKFPDWIWKRLAELGILGIIIPAKYGGAESDYLAETVC